MEPRILVKYASRSRPKRFAEGLDSILQLANSPTDLLLSFCIDLDDPLFEEYDHILRDKVERIPHFQLAYGYSKSKIDAINRDIPLVNWDILVNFSDDMRFTVYGWDHLIREGVRCNGPDVFLHYPDSTARNMLSTMSVMDRAYFERDRFIYYPEYWSVFCDNEAQEAAKLRGRYFYLGTQLFDHFHPAYGHVPWDEQYTRQQGMWDHDEKLYHYRANNKFFLDDNGQYTFVKHSYPDDQGKTAEAGATG